MSTQPFLFVFITALAVAVFSIFANLYVYIQLSKAGVEFSRALAGMPGYLLRVCVNLAPSSERNRLVRIAKWSTIAFLVAFVAAGITGPLATGGGPHG